MKMLRLKSVIEITGLSRSSIYDGVKNGTFPKQVQLSTRAVGWTSDSIESWLDSKING